MPTHEEDDLFLRDFDQLTPEQKDRFLRVLRRFIEDLESAAGAARTAPRTPSANIDVA
jgi:hypothetical protein